MSSVIISSVMTSNQYPTDVNSSPITTSSESNKIDSEDQSFRTYPSRQEYKRREPRHGSDDDDDSLLSQANEPLQPDRTQLLAAVDELFLTIDLQTVTPKDIVRSLEGTFQIKLRKSRRQLIKLRLLENIEATREKEVAAGRRNKKRKRKRVAEGDAEGEGDSSDGSDAVEDTAPSHMKIHHQMLRKRQLAEAKIRTEEIQAERIQKVDEEDRKRHELIAQRFDTNSEKARVQRIEDRLVLLNRLEEKRAVVMATEPCSKNNITTPTLRRPFTPSQKQSPMSIFDFFGGKSPQATTVRTIDARPKQITNPRATLRNALRAKQFANGNRWLARELGYDTTEDHIRDCQTVETKKKKLLLQQEVQRRRVTQERNDRWKAAIASGDGAEDESTAAVAEEGEESMVRTVVDVVEDEVVVSDVGKEEDEELVMAREIERERATLAGGSAVDGGDVDGDNDGSCDGETLAVDRSIDAEIRPNVVRHENSTEDSVEEDVQDIRQNEDEERLTQDGGLEVHTTNDATNDETLSHDVEPNIESQTGNNSTAIDNEEEAEFDDDDDDNIEPTTTIQEPHTEEDDTTTTSPQPKKAKNAAWIALLQKEAQTLKRQKANRSGGALVDAEAEEEEEEEGVTGLEDFGFTLNSTKKDDEDGGDDAGEEDFDNIVDEVSDNEGDEEAGDAGRKALAVKEETDRHKEIMRRMREGYDGRRDGIVGGVGRARGNHRFDQLVAAENRDDARRLGLLNDDELDSDDEYAGVKGAGDNEIEDETILLDKVLKERHLDTPQLPDEDFSDNDEDSVNEEVGNGSNEEDEEDLKQERIAKRFAKRARMNRLLEAHNDESQFSQSRLIDEDDNLKKELKSIRNVYCKRTRQTSDNSLLSSNSKGGWGNKASIIPHPVTCQQKIDTNNTVDVSNASSLSIGLLGFSQHQKHSRKRKTSFLGGLRSESGDKLKSNNTSAADSKGGFSLGHVVFHATEEKKREMSRCRSLPVPAGKNLNSRDMSLTRRSTFNKGNSSLWSRVSANSFRGRSR